MYTLESNKWCVSVCPGCVVYCGGVSLVCIVPQVCSCRSVRVRRLYKETLFRETNTFYFSRYNYWKCSWWNVQP